MNLLIHYLKAHKWVVVLALVLAAMNIGFSLMDPAITGKLMDRYITKAHLYQNDKHAYIMGVLELIGYAIGVAMISRIAKNFQDYFTSIIIQKVGAKMYSDGLKHSLELPYQVFEDQRSGETLSILQKVRTDSEKFITSFISILLSVLSDCYL